jgi:predicted O-methyltransferase YrrM
MYSPITLSLKYLDYLLHSSDRKGHGIHSPFVFDFITNVLNDRTAYPEYNVTENLRKKLLASNTPVPIEDYGAGRSRPSTSKSVSSIASTSAKSPRYGQLLFRIARYYQPNYIVELGTSLGVSTSYLAQADTHAVVVSGEGNYALATMAKENFKTLGLDNIDVVTGNFDNTLPEIISAIPRIDMAFIDGNHRRQPTLKYFSELRKKNSESSVLIFDDIHWSRGMELAWQDIQADPNVMLTIDLFFMGLVFFRPEFKVKQHFRIRF